MAFVNANEGRIGMREAHFLARANGRKSVDRVLNS